MATQNKRSRVLVVDDEASNRDALAALLTSAGYEVTQAEHGFDALLQMKRTVPDVVISDLNMPYMSGFELLSIIRRRFPQVSVIAFSGAYDAATAVPGGVIADSFYAKGQHHPGHLLADVAELIRTSGRREANHLNEAAPVWIPRNGRDSAGLPYVVLTCTHCLRSFPLNVPEHVDEKIQETPCLYCSTPVRYILDFSRNITSPLRPEGFKTL